VGGQRRADGRRCARNVRLVAGLSRIGRARGSDDDLVSSNPHFGADHPMADRAHHPSRRRHPLDDPYRGIGANVAIKDAARLKRALVTAHRGERDLIEAIRDYETGMREYGFRAVRNSLKAMHQTVTDSRPALMLSRLTMRIIDELPSVKRLMARRLGEE
jgi:hypothetical protein